jgi:hypothetical protein
VFAVVFQPSRKSAVRMGHPFLWLVEMGWLRFVVSHRDRKRRVRMGSPVVFRVRSFNTAPICQCA